MSEPQQPPAQPYGSPPPTQGAPAPGQPSPLHQSPQYPAQPYPGPPAPPHAYGGQPNPAQGYPGQQYPGQQPARPAGGSLGRIAFILALVSLAIALTVTLSYPLVFRTFYEPALMGAFGAVGNGLVLIVAVVALILGMVSVRRPGSQTLAGVAIGITAAQIAGIVISWASTLLYALPY